MRIKFKHQEYQTRAANAVLDCFDGQPNATGISYRVDPGEKAQTDLFVEGFKNPEIALDESELFKIAPAYSVYWPGLDFDKRQKIKKFVNYCIEPENHETGMISRPSKWYIDDKFDSWNQDLKKKYLKKYLLENRKNGHGGTCLRKIKSEVIERYLNS